MKALLWNIRSADTKKAFSRLITMQRRHHFYFVSLMEPFQDASTIEEYRTRLGMQHVVSNSSGKIWAFCDKGDQCTVVKDEEQQLTLKVFNQEGI